MSLLHSIAGCDDAGRAADVVFLHGLGGDASATWRRGRDEAGSWPCWLGREFPQVGVWSLGYPASPTKLTRFLGWFSESQRDAGYSMALPDRALQVLDRMGQRGLGDRPLFFICHSLGGLLAKQILRKSADSADPRKKQVARNTRAVLFLATPHAGAELASLLNAFRAVFGTTVSIEELRAHDAHLRDLFDWYRHHSLQLGIATATYYELRPVRGVLPIVNPTSSHPGVGADPVGLDEDHVSIAKPRTPDAQVCGAARDLLRTVVLAQRPAPASNPTAVQVQPGLPAPAPQAVIVQFAPSGAAAPRRIPHELPPAAEHYFGRQTELAQLIERLQAGKSTAVVGPAGLGKTALAAEAVRAVTGTTLETLARSPFPDGVVFLDLYTFHGQAEPAWNTLANKLEGPDFRERETGRERATEACRARRFLLVIEGGEEADGEEGRAEIRELLGVLSPENRRLLLTRLSTQAAPAESVELKEALPPEEAEKLLDSLAGERLPAAVRARVLELLEGHPLALTWAGGLLARDEEDPDRLVRDWDVGGLPGLSDPRQAEHTLKWLFARSVRGLDAPAQQVLAAAGLLARAPVPLAAAEATLGEAGEEAARDALKTLVRRGLLRRAGETDHWQLTHVLGYRFARQETGSDPELRERLGRWLHGHLQEALASGSDDDALLSRTRALEHTAALLRADDDQRLWRPLANFVLYDVWRRLMDLGRLGLARLALTAVAGWLERLPVGKAEDPGWLREKSSLLDREGDVQRDQGDLAAALTAYRESLAIRQQLAAADPAHAGRQWDLSISYERVGDVLQNQGDLAAALTAYRESLAIRQQLAAADPAHAGWQRGLSISHNKVGDVLRNQGDLDTALTAYRESLAIRQRLATTEPAHARWQRDLSVSHDRVGDVLRDQGDLNAALTAYRESLAIAHRLAAVDSAHAGWQRDLAWSLTRIAQLTEQQGNHTEALRLAQESLAIDERLAALDPTNVMWQKDVAFSRQLVARLKGSASPST